MVSVWIKDDMLDSELKPIEIEESPEEENGMTKQTDTSTSVKHVEKEEGKEGVEKKTLSPVSEEGGEVELMLPSIQDGIKTVEVNDIDNRLV